MPSLEVASQENNDDPGPINAVVGIIYPPPEVRSILIMMKYIVTTHYMYTFLTS